MCGTLIGEGNGNSAPSNTNNITTAINTLKFVETSKGYSREIQASLTDEVGISWGGAAIAAIVGGQISRGKSTNGRPAIHNVTPVASQQLSLLNYEPDEDGKAVVDAVAQLPAVQGVDADKLKQIFRHNGEQLQLMETRLKAANKLDAARRLTYSVLLYALDVDGRQEIPRTELNDILKRVGLYNNNTATWIGKSAELIVEKDMVGLRLPGKEQARKVIAEVLDSNIPNKWNLSAGSASRGGKSGTKGDEDAENATRHNNRKSNGFSKEVESWVVAWKTLATSFDVHAAIKDCPVVEKGCFGLWAISRATSKPEIVVSSYKLQQFLYLGFGIKLDERHLERSLKAVSGKGSLIKVQSGFRLLHPGVVEVERLIGYTQDNSQMNAPSSNSSEVQP